MGVSLEEREIELAVEDFQLAKRWEAEKKMGAAKYRYETTVKYLMWAGEYINAYRLAEKYNLELLAKEVHTKGIKVLESLGRFNEAGVLEIVKGNVKRAENYRDWGALLRPA